MHKMSSTNSNLPTRSRCCQGLRSVWSKLLDVQPKEPPTDPKCLLWFKRVTLSRFDILLPFVQAFFVLLDTGFDLHVAVSHYKQRHRYWALYTVIIVVITQIFVQAVSAFWFIEDKRDESQKQNAMRENGVEVKNWVIIFHLMVFGRFVRFYQMWKVLRKIRKGDKTPLDTERARRKFIRRYMLYVSQIVDCNTLQLMESFLEQAPQVVLQVYILAQQNHVDVTSPNGLLVTLNIIKSLLFFALSHLTYARDMRRQDEDSAQLKWLSKGAVSLYFWRLLMLVSRILALAFFASAFKPVYTSVLIALHFVVFLFIVAKQECDYFEDSPKKQLLLKLAFAYIHIFSFFPLVSTKTGAWGYVYYCITFLENTFVLLLWMCHSEGDWSFEITAVVIEKVCFFLGLICMVLYYRWFHPSLIPTTEERNEVNYKQIAEDPCGERLFSETAV